MDAEAGFHWSEGMKFVAEGIKSLLLINGAATVSLLTFIGNTKSDSGFLVYAMMVFALGAFTSPLSFLCAYLAQLQYGNGNFDAAWPFHKWTYIFVGLGAASFFLGAIFAGIGLLSESSKQDAGYFFA